MDRSSGPFFCRSSHAAYLTVHGLFGLSHLFPGDHCLGLGSTYIWAWRSDQYLRDKTKVKIFFSFFFFRPALNKINIGCQHIIYYNNSYNY